MKAPSLTVGSTAVGMLKSLGFINITGVRIFEGRTIKKTIDFSSSRFRNRWSRKKCFTVVVDNEGSVYLRYGSDDITKGQVFQEAINELGCTIDPEFMLVAACTPSEGQQFDSEDLLKLICGQSVLS